MLQVHSILILGCWASMWSKPQPCQMGGNARMARPRPSSPEAQVRCCPPCLLGVAGQTCSLWMLNLLSAAAHVAQRPAPDTDMPEAAQCCP